MQREPGVSVHSDLDRQGLLGAAGVPAGRRSSPHGRAMEDPGTVRCCVHSFPFRVSGNAITRGISERDDDTPWQNAQCSRFTRELAPGDSFLKRCQVVVGDDPGCRRGLHCVRLKLIGADGRSANHASSES